ncbi:30S ribosomal protein S6 [Proteiniphilum propionicum]|jgi:small subunit ribosomal protein S6|nr:30S ribosomal protein S6 [Proteiniphilum propionicum]
MNNYETVFILTPVLSDVQMKEAVEKFKKLLTDQGAEIVNEEDWGLRKLAYPIDKKTTGFYAFLEFKADPSMIERLEVNFRRDERVIRFLTVKQDRFALEYAEKRRNNKGGKRHEARPQASETVKTRKTETAVAVEDVELNEKED